MAIPTLFTSPKVQHDFSKFGPFHWNTVTALLTSLLGGPEADGLVLTKNAASPNGASWASAGAVTVPDPLTVSTIQGGSGVASSLTLKPTTGVGTTGADIVFKVGNNGATEVLRLLNAGNARLPNNVYLLGRNAADSADINLIRLNSSNQIDLGVTVNASSINFSGTMSGPQFTATGSGGFSAPAGGFFSIAGRGYFDATADGVWRINNAAGTAFTRLMFGGATASFPALTRNAATLETKLADNSGYAQHAALIFALVDGATPPGATAGLAKLYVDTADGDLKVIFGDGTIKTISVDT